jgi:2,4'-dihydroxyacetophenone dioxygenase
MKPSAYPVDAGAIAWVPLREGVAMRPLHFAADGYSLLLRVEPGVTIARHRHTGEVHAYNLEGCRELIETGEIAGPGTHVYEPPGNADSWRGVGDVPCVIQVSLKGRIEYLGEHGAACHGHACGLRGLSAGLQGTGARAQPGALPGRGPGAPGRCHRDVIMSPKEDCGKGAARSAPHGTGADVCEEGDGLKQSLAETSPSRSKAIW